MMVFMIGDFWPYQDQHLFVRRDNVRWAAYLVLVTEVERACRIALLSLLRRNQIGLPIKSSRR